MDEKFVDQYAELERNHWWFLGRRKILKSLLKSLDWNSSSKALEIGVGSGQNLYSLYPSDVQLCGMEVHAQNVRHASSLGPIPVYEGALEDFPQELKKEKFDCIFMFDVLEHIEDDESSLKHLHQRLKKEGRLIMTVPSYRWLWGNHDEVNHHFRRYTIKNMTKKLKNSNFQIKRATYFNTFLFLPISLFRIFTRFLGKKPPRTGSDFDYSFGWFNTVLSKIFGLEAVVLSHLNFPFGVSLFVIAEKK